MEDRIQMLVLAAVLLFILVLFAVSARDELSDGGFVRGRAASTYADPAGVDESGESDVTMDGEGADR